MEENPKLRSQAFLVWCLLAGAVAGFLGALLGAIQAHGGGIFSLNERIAGTSAAGGPLVGIGCGYALAIVAPRRGHWAGCMGWTFLLAVDVAVSGTLAWIVFFVAARMMRA